MITHIEISGFKSLQEVSLDLGGLNIFVGTNASGKTNFLDALRVLQGIGYGFTIEEIFNGKPKSASSEVWEPIRGGRDNAGFVSWTSAAATPVQGLVRFAVRLKSSELEQQLAYSIAVSMQEGNIREESLRLGDAPVFSSGGTRGLPPSMIPVDYTGGEHGPLGFERSRPVLRQVLKSRHCTERDAELIEICARLLSNTQLLDPSPTFLRGYSTPSKVRRMGERGENFAGLVRSILSDDSNATAYTSWLKQLTPTELDEVETLPGALQEPLFAFKRRGHGFPAPVLSDGTLRFAAIAAAFFQPDMPDTLMIEEIENGIHPTRLRLLVELLRSQAANGGPQVMATSHSPLVLAWLNEEDHKTTFFCKKDEETGASTITPLSSVPRFKDLVRKQPVADLFAEGWLEGAL